MALEVQGNYSQNNMASVPSPSNDEDVTKGKPSGASANINGETVSEEAPDADESGEVSPQQPKQSFGSKLKDAIMSGFGRAGGGVTASFSAAAVTIASALRIPPAVASVGMALILAGAAGTGVIAVDQYVNTLNPALFVSNDCEERVAEAKTKDTTDSAVDEEAEKEKNAKIIYSALKGILGMDDAHIAAVLSNFTTESGIDPTGVETIYTEPYRMGERKQAAMADIDSFTRNVVFNAYAGICTLNTAFYCEPDGVARCGIGLAGETGPNCKQLLEDAEGLGQDWWDMEFQFAWELATYEDKWSAFKGESGDCESLALWFVHNYEGNYCFDAQHMATAKEWEAKMASWTVDQSVVNNISKLMEQMGATGSKKEVAKRQEECTPCRSNAADYDNSSIAAAAASYAYPHAGDGVGNDGTELYVKVHDGVFPGDTIYRSCDRSAASAIRWSGKDDDVPPGSTTETEQHFEAEEGKKWKNVTSEIHSIDDLEPGDIWNTVTNGHIFVYCGEDIIQEIHGSEAASGMNMVEGSYPVQSPECSTLTIGSTGSEIYRSGDGRPYYVWRCINEEVSDKYTGVAEGVTVSSASGKKSGSKNCGDSSKNANRNKADLLKPNGDVDWSLSKDEFVNNWAYAIDQFLYGHGLQGKGKAFAEAAWKYHVDPRLCPAISNTESTRGDNCFLPYNAWGYGDFSFSSWEEGIDRVTKCLGTDPDYKDGISEKMAKKYCPPTWESWYKNTVTYMNEIQSSYKKF